MSEFLSILLKKKESAETLRFTSCQSPLVVPEHIYVFAAAQSGAAPQAQEDASDAR